MTSKAFCKINLTLEILGRKRNDGFHDVVTVMKKLPFGDDVELDVNDTGVVELFCDKNVCRTEDNLAYRAARMYLDEYFRLTGHTSGAVIRIKKNVPTGAGLGGGSADAAAVLDMLCACLGVVSEAAIYDIAATLGSDVPFCLAAHTLSLSFGRGEKLHDIEARFPACFVLVAKPHEGLETKAVYDRYDTRYGDDYSKNKSEMLVKELLSGSELNKLAEFFVNDFEEICADYMPVIAEIRRIMLEYGAVVSQMTGSGSAVFGLFENHNNCENCRAALESAGAGDVFDAFVDK